MKTKEMKGITLIALVVTIVVLLILTGVGINLVIGDNGIITMAQKAKSEYEEAKKREERILLIDIVSLCKKNGYCWPTNRYFMKKFDCTKPTVSKSISSLSRNGYIDIEINNSETNNSKRIIKLSEVLKKRITSIQRNTNTSIQNNFTIIINIIKIKTIY